MWYQWIELLHIDIQTTVFLHIQSLKTTEKKVLGGRCGAATKACLTLGNAHIQGLIIVIARNMF